MHTFDLNLNEISKIEGKASLEIKVRSGKIEDLKFKISEFKRFYTQAIRGKDIIALPQLSCRICGTCSNAHLLCAIKAVENAVDLKVSEQTKILRELLNYGLIIRDHALHLYVFALPDILGVDSILELDEKKPDEHQILDDTFLVKSAGNLMSKVIGGRSVHAPYPTVGGFSKLPDEKNFKSVIEKLKEAREAVLRLIDIFYKCEYDFQQEIDSVCLMDDKFSYLYGNIVDSKGEKIAKDKFGDHLEKIVIPYSQASGYKYKGNIYLVGALARINLAKDKLHKETKTSIQKVLSIFPSKNIYHNNLAQAIEILHTIDVSVEILEGLKIVEEMPIKPERKESIGIGVMEAPRGTLYYKLFIDSAGKIKEGNIIVPTGQNQISIEKSIYEYLSKNMSKDKDELVGDIEKIIRAYDPCMSCASHFLKVKWL